MPSIPISKATSGDSTLVAAPSGNRFIRVYAYIMTAAGAVSFTLKDSVTGPLTGATPLITGTPCDSDYAGEGWFDLGVGSDLVLNLSAAVQVSGHLKYEIKG